MLVIIIINKKVQQYIYTIFKSLWSLCAFSFKDGPTPGQPHWIRFKLPYLLKTFFAMLMISVWDFWVTWEFIKKLKQWNVPTIFIVT